MVAYRLSAFGRSTLALILGKLLAVNIWLSAGSWMLIPRLYVGGEFDSNSCMVEMRMSPPKVKV